MSPYRIAVLFGGCSPEYSVSLESASAVIRHMDPAICQPILVGISSQGDWFHFRGDLDKIAADTWCNPADCTPATLSLSRSQPQLLCFPAEGGVEAIPLDAAFPILHGRGGEDGTVQGAFALAGIPVIGCGVLSSALCMDKYRAHQLAQAAGVAVPASHLVQPDTPAQQWASWAAALGYPLFVKPLRAGSSFGISKVLSAQQLPAALEAAFAYDDTALLEECIPGFEVGCALLGTHSLEAGRVDEIELADGFFDFKEKYTLETASIHVPARITPEQEAQVLQAAKTVYRALDCHGFARVDLFCTPDGRVAFNEVNTIPGFTAHSRFPSMFQAAGLSFSQMIAEIIRQGVSA